MSESKISKEQHFSLESFEVSTSVSVRWYYSLSSMHTSKRLNVKTTIIHADGVT